MGATHGDPATYPRLADVIGFVTPDQVIAVAEAVVTAQRDHGGRVDRKHARLKYTIDDHGLDWFKDEVERRAGFPLRPARPFAFDHNRSEEHTSELQSLMRISYAVYCLNKQNC